MSAALPLVVTPPAPHLPDLGGMLLAGGVAVVGPVADLAQDAGTLPIGVAPVYELVQSLILLWIAKQIFGFGNNQNHNNGGTK